LLFGYWAPLVRDLGSVLIRRERARQLVLMGVVVGGFSFAGTVVLDHLAVAENVVDFDGDGETTHSDRQFLVRLWWAFRQVQDPGNMMQDPASLVAVVVSVVLTVVGLFLVSFLIGVGTDVVRELMEVTRLRPPGLRGHTVVVNVTPSTRPLLTELMGYYRKLVPEGRPWSRQWLRRLFSAAAVERRFRGPQYVVVGRKAEPPDFLREDPELARVVYRQGGRGWDDFARRVDVRTAQRVVLLADLSSPDPDADTMHSMLRLVSRMRVDGVDGARQRLLIAEILDESNVPAAHAAVARHGEQVRAFVVPTERLLALFAACVVRRPRVAELLDVLLTSKGSELYTCFFSLSGLGYQCGNPPELPERPDQALAVLREYARAQPDSRVMPVGLVYDAPRSDEFSATINPGPPTADEERRAPAGFVALAPTFADVREFTETLCVPGTTREPAASGPAPWAGTLRGVAPLDLRRVMVGGWRSAAVSMLESLLWGEDDLEVLVLVPDEATLKAARDDFDAHNKLLMHRLMRGPHASFPALEDGAIGFLPPGRSSDARPRIRLVVGEQSSSRQLAALPVGFGHVADLDAVILLSTEAPGADARATKTLMKIEALLDASQRSATRVVAEVLDADLAEQLRERYEKLEMDDVRVHSIQELRSFFMFQSLVVPSFDNVYAELLGAWGQSFRRFELRDLEDGGQPPISTWALADRLQREHGALFVGVETRHGGTRSFEPGGQGTDGRGHVDARLRPTIWAIGPDTPGPGGGTLEIVDPPGEEAEV
jgi:hypothetical protein